MSSADQQRTPEQEGDSPTLHQVGKLLLYDELLVKWAAKEPSRATLFKRVYGCVGRLESETGWEIEPLLKRLGCNTEKEDFDEKLNPRRLAMCIEYMEWVEDLLGMFDLQYDKRIVLKGASGLYESAEEDLEVAVEIMEADGIPHRYLALGEIGQAWRAAARRLEGPVGERARRIHASNPFFTDEDAPHVSSERLKILASARPAELLGPQVALRMREHVDHCPQCSLAWSRLSIPTDVGSVGVLR